jgi:hypothetical protein
VLLQNSNLPNYVKEKGRNVLEPISNPLALGLFNSQELIEFLLHARCLTLTLFRFAPGGQDRKQAL